MPSEELVAVVTGSPAPIKARRTVLAKTWKVNRLDVNGYCKRWWPIAFSTHLLVNALRIHPRVPYLYIS